MGKEQYGQRAVFSGGLGVEVVVLKSILSQVERGVGGLWLARHSAIEEMGHLIAWNCEHRQRAKSKEQWPPCWRVAAAARRVAQHINEMVPPYRSDI